MESCTTATISPPPASASCGRVRAIHVHHPTGAAVATSPQTPNSTVVAVTEAPTAMSVTAIAAISTGMIASVP